MTIKRLINMCVTRSASWWNHPGHKDFKSQLLEHDFSIYTDSDYYSEHAIYPEIQPKYPISNHNWGNMDPKIAWSFEHYGQELDKIKTVEEKLAILAHHNCYVDLDKYGKMFVQRHHIWQLQGLMTSARSLPIVKYLTNTHDASLSDIYLDRFKNHHLSEELSNTIEHLSFDDEPTMPLACEYSAEDPEKYIAPILKEKHLEEQKRKNRSFISKIAHTLFVNLPPNSVCYNNDAQISAFWKRGGFSSVGQKIRGKRNDEGDDIRSFQFEDTAIAQLKRNLPLEPITSISYGKEKFGRVPFYLYHPALFNIFTDQTLPMQIPGQWYGSKHPFNLLTIYSTEKLKNLKWLSASEDISRDNVISWAILAGHAELTAQAYHLGFSLWKRDITYPMVAQIVLIDGDQLTFATYQLNSLQIFKDQYSDVWPNICWVSPTMKWGSDSARILVQMATMPATISVDVDLSPYLMQRKNLATERHRQFARQLYDSVRHCRNQSRFDTRKIKSSNAGTNFFKWYDDLCLRFRELVREEYPKQWWGHTLQRIDKIRSHPTEYNYDKLKPDEKTTFIYEY